jgi:hypothetical protein
MRNQTLPGNLLIQLPLLFMLALAAGCAKKAGPEKAKPAETVPAAPPAELGAPAPAPALATTDSQETSGARSSDYELHSRPMHGRTKPEPGSADLAPPPGEAGFPEAYTQAGEPVDAVPRELRCNMSANLQLPDGTTDILTRYCQDEGMLELQLVNTRSDRVNPSGTGAGLWEDAVRRTFRFQAPGLGRQELLLYVLDETRPGEGDSKSSMHSELRFFPRRALPRTTLSADGAKITVRLPTGEDVTFDSRTKEISGGVLSETFPIDTNPNRHARNFARFAYSGQGIVLRSNQRGESTRAAVVFGVAKKSTVTRGARSCQVPNELLWEQGNREARFRFASDAEFFAFLRAQPQCRTLDLTGL